MEPKLFADSDPEELAAASGLDDAVLAALPADAPKGHAAYAKVTWHTRQSGFASFKYPDGSGGQIYFQTTAGQSGSAYSALRIARACYMRFEKKEPKDQVLAFRDECYKKLKSHGCDENQPLADVRYEAQPLPDPEELAAASGLDDAVLAALPPDAPKGHMSYWKVAWRETQSIAVFRYPDGSGGQVNFQTTKSKAESTYSALRIARACYMRFEKKESKDQVLAFRDACYKKLKSQGCDEDQLLADMRYEDQSLPDPEELAAASGLDDVLLAALPPDAPKGHVAYKKVSWRERQSIALFRYSDGSGGALNFQTTKKESESSYSAMRIARACYMRFENKESKDQVLAFREACYQVVRSRGYRRLPEVLQLVTEARMLEKKDTKFPNVTDAPSKMQASRKIKCHEEELQRNSDLESKRIIEPCREQMEVSQDLPPARSTGKRTPSTDLQGQSPCKKAKQAPLGTPVKTPFPSDAVVRRTACGLNGLSPYMDKRCEQCDGKSVQECLKLQYTKACGTVANYTLRDLKYDVQFKRLEIVLPGRTRPKAATVLGKSARAIIASRTKPALGTSPLPLDAIVRRTEHKIGKTPHIDQRCADCDGKTVQECLKLQFTKPDGAVANYTMADLRYDVSHKRLRLEDANLEDSQGQSKIVEVPDSAFESDLGEPAQSSPKAKVVASKPHNVEVLSDMPAMDIGRFYAFCQCSLKMEAQHFANYDVKLTDPLAIQIWPDVEKLCVRNLKKNEKWVPFHTVLGVHELYVVKDIHSARVTEWDDYRRFILMFVFRAHCKCDLFDVQKPLMKDEEFWKDPCHAFRTGSPMEKAIKAFRQKGNALQTNCFLIIPERLLEDDDDNLILNLLLRTQKLVTLASELWPVVNNTEMSSEHKYGIIREKILRVKGLGETWVKMLAVVLDIARPHMRLLHDRCEVGVGASDPLRKILEQEDLLLPREQRVAKASIMQALIQLRDRVTSCELPSATHFQSIVEKVEKRMCEHFKEYPLVVQQMRTHKLGLSCGTLQVQLCEFRQFENSLRSKTSNP